MKNRTFIDFLRSNTELDCDLIIGGAETSASFVWNEDSQITEYGISKYRPIMDAEYTILANGNI